MKGYHFFGTYEKYCKLYFGRGGHDEFDNLGNCEGWSINIGNWDVFR